MQISQALVDINIRFNKFGFITFISSNSLNLICFRRLLYYVDSETYALRLQIDEYTFTAAAR